MKCQKVDHVAVRVNEKQNQFCRACAETTIKIFDQGRVIDDEKVSRTCDQCRQTFWVNKQVAGKKEELRCLDCLRGFEVWRGKITTNSCKKPRTILTKVGSKTTFRKNIHDDV
ncbi:MAG TPA: hypothetical protein VEL47_03545 [Myxococcota bacterium]|nr:hypothetical protein [Myxococcota bacterium]